MLSFHNSHNTLLLRLCSMQTGTFQQTHGSAFWNPEGQGQVGRSKRGKRPFSPMGSQAAAPILATGIAAV